MGEGAQVDDEEKIKKRKKGRFWLHPTWHHAALCGFGPQGKILKMMEDNKHLAHRIDGAIQSASQEVTNLRSELSTTSRRLAELGASSPPALENHHHQYNHQDDSFRYRGECHSTRASVWRAECLFGNVLVFENSFFPSNCTLEWKAAGGKEKMRQAECCY